MPDGIGFIGRTQRYSVGIGRKDLRFSIPGDRTSSSVVLSLKGSDAGAPIGITPVPFLTNYYLGSDPSKYRHGIRNYSRVGLSRVYPGIDAEFYAAGDAIEHDFIVAPDANADLIAMQLRGASRTTLSSRGEVLISVESGELRFKKPVAYQESAAGKRIEVAATFLLEQTIDGQDLRFKLGTYDHSKKLIIDPVIVYSSFVAGTAGSTASAIATDPINGIFIAGTTTSAANTFAPTPVTSTATPITPVANCGTASCANNAFIANFSNNGSGIALQWITYVGATDPASTIAVSSIVENTAGVYIGGYTNDSAIAAGPATTASNPSTAGGYVGYISTLAPTTGTLTATALVYTDADPASANSNSVQTLALDGSGSLYAAGTLGSKTTAALVLTPSADAFPITPIMTAQVNAPPSPQVPSLPGNAYVLRVSTASSFSDSSINHLVIPAYFSYIQNTSQINGIAVDALGSIYLGGQTLGSFSLPNATATNSDTGGTTFDAFELTFQDVTVSPATSNSSVVTGFSWIDGNKDDTVAGLAIDLAGNSYLFGNTASTNLATTAGAIQGTGVDTVANGFIAQLPPAQLASTPPLIPVNGVPPTVLTYLGGSGSTDTISAGTYANGTLFITGQTDAPAITAAPATAFAGVVTTTGTSSTPFVPQAMVFGMDATTVAPAGSKRGYLALLNSTLTAVNYVANIGGAGISDSVAGVALDNESNAYIVANIGYDSVTASTPPFTPYTAYQTISPATSSNSSAYLAEVASAGLSANLTFAALTPGSPMPATIGFPDANNASTVVYTWTLTQAPSTTSAIAPANVVIQIPAPSDPALVYTSVTITDVTNSAVPAITCPLEPQGAYCVIPSYPQMTPGTNDQLNLVVNAKVVADPAGSTITVIANLFTAASEYYSAPQVSQTLSALLSITPGATFGASTASAISNPTGTQSTQVTYAFTVANAAGAGESKNTSFTLDPSALTALPTGLNLSVPTTTLSGVTNTPTCTSTGCTGIDLPGGASLTYTVVGTYPDSAVSSTSASSLISSAFVVSSSGYQSTVPNQSITANTTVQRSVHLALTTSFSALPIGQLGYNLKVPLTYMVLITNSGPSTSSGHDQLTLTLPAGFTATGGAEITCLTSFTTCTIPIIPAGSSVTYTLTGSFPDTSANMSVNGIGSAGLQAENFSAAATLNLGFAVETGGPPTDYISSNSIMVQRTANLTISTHSLTPLLTTASCSSGAPGSCVYMHNSGDTADQLGYAVTIDNAGPDTATGVILTIDLPIAPPTPTQTPAQHPLPVLNPTKAFGTPDFGTMLSCTIPASTNQYVCTGNIPVGTSVATISGSGTFDSATVPLSTATITTGSAGGTLGSIVITENANGAPAPLTLPSIEIDRAAHLVITKTVTLSGTKPLSPINLDENSSSTTCGVNDCFTAALQIANTPLNDVPGVTLTDVLPNYFRFVQLPSAAANCTIGGVAPTLAYRTQALPVAMMCAIGTVSAGSSAVPPPVPPPPFTLTYTGKFVDNGINADITGTMPSKQSLVNPVTSLQSAVATTTLAIDPSPSALPNNHSAASPIAIERLTHLVLRKTRNDSVATAPSTFVLAYPNLDEKTSATPFGTNDEIEYDVAVGNAGPNIAVGVQFTEQLPPYFTLINYYLASGVSLNPDTGANMAPASQLPHNNLLCFSDAPGGTPLTMPYQTGAAGKSIVCSYGTPASGAPTSPNYQSLPVGSSKSGAPDNATSIEFIYQGKYQDNAPGIDNLGLNVSSTQITSQPGESTTSSTLEVDTDLDNKSIPVPAYSIQRAAHLTLVGTPRQLTIAEQELPSLPNMPSMIAQAAPSSLPNTSPVYNCIRYKVLIQNSGPNIARQPQLTIVKPTGITLAAAPTVSTTTPDSSVLPDACAYTPGAAIGSVIPSSAGIAPTSQVAGNTLVVDIDGYFGLNTLVGRNAQTGFNISYSGLADQGVSDTVKTSTFSALTGGSVTVVNTPYGSNFQVAPFSPALTQPANLSFGTITAPGATTLALSSAGPALPSGASPDPRDNKKVIPLYRAGAAPTFYTLATTAIPQAGSNPTGICLTNGSSALADSFAKPERALLWALSGLPTGTTVNPVPNAAAPYLGDITTSLTPFAKPSYVTPGGLLLPYTSYVAIPAPQSQPKQICGQVNGFAPNVAPVTVAVLEPVNFAPYISSSTQVASQTPGKGVSEVSFLFPSAIHDYNDHDPCYVSDSSTGTPRGICDDNLILTTWIFGGESLIPSLSHVIGPLLPAAATAFETAATPYEVQANATLYVQVADQLAVPIYNNPPYQDCDPGDPSSSYTPVTSVKPCPIDASRLAGTPPQEIAFGSADVTLLTPSINGGSGGLIILPPASDATLATTPVQAGYITAAATVTSGQTVGFQWKLGDVIPASGGTYNLACFMVDAATQNSPIALAIGLSCQIPATIVYPPNPTTTTSPANPAIYVVTTGTINARNTSPSWGTAAVSILAATLLPLLLFRRRDVDAKRFSLFVMLLLLGGAVSLSGCGSGVGVTNIPTAAAASTYFFRASATPIKGGTILITAPFDVTVVAGN
uniref:beta strand repeat-containing protein n=1 Tax=Granulicella arctica TaxID=940613 RepID=UPI0021E07DDC|nr:hypothetical protein [Granulicella arctica]